MNHYIEPCEFCKKQTCDLCIYGVGINEGFCKIQFDDDKTNEEKRQWMYQYFTKLKYGSKRINRQKPTRCVKKLIDKQYSCNTDATKKVCKNKRWVKGGNK